MSEGYSPLEGGGLQRTEIHCHNCSKNFVAELDFDVNGNHEIVCPVCDHIHYRTIKNGLITGDRYSSSAEQTVRVEGRSVWQSSVIKAKTSTVAHFLRERWLNRSDVSHG